MSTNSPLKFASVNRYTLVTAVAWTLLVAGTLVWNIHDERMATIELAAREAQATFNKDQAFRFWATKHGGVYVRVTEEMQPNPYLSQVPDRDITLPSGKQLTLMNPAFIMRQVMTEFEALYGIKGHITSLKLLNPINEPDAWEQKALGEMERGTKEITEISAIDGKKYLRLMRPMKTQKACLKCHAHQGYKEGDIRGGVGISLPLEPFFASERTVEAKLLISHGVIWFIGLGGIGFISRRTRDGIVQQLQAQEALQLSESKYRKIFENVQDVFFQTDRNGNFTDVSPSILRYSGYSRDELIGTPVAQYYWDPQDRTGFVKALQEKGEVADFEIRMRRRDNRLVHASVNAHLHYDAEGTPAGAEGSIRDLTERKHAEEALRKTNELLERVFSVGHIMIAYMDRDFNFIRVNDAYAASAEGQSPEFFIGKNHFTLYPYKENEKIFRTVIETGEPYHAYNRAFEYANHPERGISYWDWTLLPVKAADRSVQGLVMIMQNVTERRRSAEEKEKLEQQLRQAQKMEAIGQLAGGIAHDFNNILSAIIGYGSILQMKMGTDDPLRVNADHLIESANRAAHLTKSLLAFSRKQIMNARPVDLNRIITNVEKFLRRIIGEDVDIRTTTAAGELIINADTGQIEQVLMNLATNARDAMPRGGILAIEAKQMHIDDGFIKAHGYGEPGDYAAVSVSDSGMGMDEEIRKRIFEPFFTTKELGRGTGLGLAIVYGIVQQHHGFISVYSEPGQGTTFRIYLPIEPAAVPEAPAPESAYPARGNETILLAEDDESLRTMTSAILQEFGYTVIVAEDGEDALLKFRENEDRIQLLLLDMIMPKRTGNEVYEEIARRKPDMNVIFISGYTPDILGVRGFTGQTIAEIQKPILPKDLLGKIRALLDAKKT